MLRKVPTLSRDPLLSVLLFFKKVIILKKKVFYLLQLSTLERLPK